MYEKDDIIMYPGTGVCRIVDIVTQKFMRTEEKTYYVLKPVYDSANSTIYCPVDNTAIKLRKLLDEKSIKAMIGGVCSAEPLWIENDAERKKVFSEIIRDGDQNKIVRMIKEIHEKKTEKEKNGKKLHSSDERLLHEAEKTVHQDLAYSMNIKPEEVAAFIMREMNIEA